MKTIPGFDYVTGKPLVLTRQEWVFLFEKAARRRVEKGETFAHDSNGGLLFEAYANIELPGEPDWLK